MPAPQPTAAASRSPLDDALRQPEWLRTDGFGGYGMGTRSGLPTRRYHAWLIASQKPPLDRVVVVRAALERLVLPDGTDRWLSGVCFGDGSQTDVSAASSFDESRCEWTFDIRPWGTLRRRLEFAPGAVRVAWTWTGLPGAWLEARLLTPLRDFHSLHRGEQTIETDLAGDTRRCTGPDAEALFTWQHADFVDAPEIWWNVAYAHERNRGYDFAEDLPSPGLIVAALGEEPVTLTARETGYPAPTSWDANDDAANEDAFERAANAYVVRSGPSPDAASQTTILAGYPWFGDWGRDTMIALPGLLLETHRFEEALSVIRRFADARQNGLIPNRFSDSGVGAEYNTADASLWLLHAATEWALNTNDHDRFRDQLLPACLDIVERYWNGTSADGADIRVDHADGLVIAGAPHTQLTWMDARRDGVTFTPRHGKPIELSALWAHGLARLAQLAETAERESLQRRADQAAQSVRDLFFDADRGWCADRLEHTPDGWKPVFELRPNQLFAISLEHGPIRGDAASATVRSCIDALWTPRGVRTLAPDHPDYRPRFTGTMFERDAAYHQGTAWPWLLGPLVEAAIRSGLSSHEAAKLLGALDTPATGPCPGQVAEVYDGGGWSGSPDSWTDDADHPQQPGGCPAQAWSVAEILRVKRLVASRAAAL